VQSFLHSELISVARVIRQEKVFKCVAWILPWTQKYPALCHANLKAMLNVGSG